MARKAGTPPPPLPPPQLVVSREDARAKIEDRITRGGELVQRAVRSWEELEGARNDYYTWSEFNTELLRRLFTNESIAEEYSSFGIAFAVAEEPRFGPEVKQFHDDVGGKIRRLESIKQRLELIPTAASVAEATAVTSATPAAPRKVAGRRIFLVHGHDEAAREMTARYLERLGNEVVILHEQVSGSRTVIEKLEHHSAVDFAVVLLTPDDVGAAAAARDALKPRARQNVVLELGYFVGKLGRRNVCALYKGTVDLPSDILGVVYVPMEGEWRLLLAKELREAGFDIDLNNLAT